MEKLSFVCGTEDKLKTRRLPMSATLKRKEGQNRLLSQMPNEKILPLSKHTPFNWKNKHNKSNTRIHKTIIKFQDQHEDIDVVSTGIIAKSRVN